MHGSLGHKLLNYARFKSHQGDGMFSVAEYRAFMFNNIKASAIQQSIGRLVRNGHLQKFQNGRYKYVKNSTLFELDRWYKENLFNKAKNKDPNSVERQELADIQSDAL
jgi:predicted transcriptional regulator of viral defense system